MTRPLTHLRDTDSWEEMLGFVFAERGERGFTALEWRAILADAKELPAEARYVLDNGYPTALLRRITGEPFGGFMVLPEATRPADGTWKYADGTVFTSSPERWQVLSVDGVAADPAWHRFVEWWRSELPGPVLSAVELEEQIYRLPADSPVIPDVIGHPMHRLPWWDRFVPILRLMGGTSFDETEIKVRRDEGHNDLIAIGPDGWGMHDIDRLAEMTPFLEAWRAVFGTRATSAAELYEACGDRLSPAMRGLPLLRRQTVLGKILASLADSPDVPVFGAGRNRLKARLYRLE